MTLTGSQPVQLKPSAQPLALKAVVPQPQASAAPVRAADSYRPAPVVAPAAPEPAPGLFARVKAGVLGALVAGVTWLMRRSTWVNDAVGHLSGPFVKQRFNAPAKPGQDPGPAPLTEAQIKAAEAQLRANFDPAKGKVVVGIAGTEDETVHAFVVSRVLPDGTVMITQALAKSDGPPEEYKGLGGAISKFLDRKLGNEPRQMRGVVEEPWASYAARSHRNTAIVMSLQTDPAKAQEAISTLRSFVGRPYDKTMLAAEPATAASEAGMYCTEIAAWFVNKLAPGTVKMSKNSGLAAFTVSDLMKATEVHGGPLRVHHNAEQRLDIRAADPHPKGR